MNIRSHKWENISVVKIVQFNQVGFTRKKEIRPNETITKTNHEDKDEIYMIMKTIW